MGARRVAYRVLVRISGGNKPLGIPRCMWKDNISMGLQEVEWGFMDWTDLAQDRDMWEGGCECGNETSGSIKCGGFLD
jgi:hypothetical protein